jgi:hypothetical protein
VRNPDDRDALTRLDLGSLDHRPGRPRWGRVWPVAGIPSSQVLWFVVAAFTFGISN